MNIRAVGVHLSCVWGPVAPTTSATGPHRQYHWPRKAISSGFQTFKYSPEHGLVWVITDCFERKLLDIGVHTIWRPDDSGACGSVRGETGHLRMTGLSQAGPPPLHVRATPTLGQGSSRETSTDT